MGSNFARKSLLEPDEIDDRVNGFTIDLVNQGGMTFRRFTFESGFKAGIDLKEAFGIELCPVPHKLVVTSGRGVFKMTDGSEHEVGPWDVLEMDADHDFWTLGDEPCVMLEPSATSDS
jgi:hypothetical protein